MSNYIDFKNIIEWANRDMDCKKIKFYISFKELDKKCFCFTIRRYNNCIAIFDSNDNLLLTIAFDEKYSNRKVSNTINKHFDLSNKGKCNVIVSYINPCNDKFEYFDFECNIRRYNNNVCSW